jgi:hypothetical protein
VGTGEKDTVAVADDVRELVGEYDGVSAGRHAEYGALLHSPGCSAPLTQQSQQMDAAGLTAHGVQL